MDGHEHGPGNGPGHGHGPGPGQIIHVQEKCGPSPGGFYSLNIFVEGLLNSRPRVSPPC